MCDDDNDDDDVDDDDGFFVGCWPIDPQQYVYNVTLDARWYHRRQLR
jgi:hypothetical protein